MKRTDVVALLAGFVFALGLGISGMTQPSKVIGFLDVTGAWDASLAFVMMGAIGVHFVFARMARAAVAPRFAPDFRLPTVTGIDRRLIAGSALFGAGWGIAGFCPGPAIVALVSLSPNTLVFVLAMLAGMGVYSLMFERAGDQAAQPAE